ncbi:hypothetical protein [Crassaminicella profunda]|uniref:hypothetical protein n=1 Tax=Crassaminicella profunda TaxID=1286698 RepID=UPI001CA78C33|nr:hypothetical protein [Crassaminicella profunda]QZY56146.1 hypothetical protein K7H06_03865 [Crassaminicella profunda]
MKLSEIISILSAKTYTDPFDLDISIEFCRASDLLSEVLINSKDHTILLTGLINTHVIRTAEILDIKAIVFVRGKKPSKEMIELASNTGVILLGTDYKLYKCCGLLYSHGLCD